MLNLVSLQIGNRLFHLDHAADVAGLQTQLTEAVQQGGGMVTIPVARREEQVEALVSPGLHIIFETRFVDAGAEGWEPGDDLRGDDWTLSFEDDFLDFG